MNGFIIGFIVAFVLFSLIGAITACMLSSKISQDEEWRIEDGKLK